MDKILIDKGAQISLLSKSGLECQHPDLMIKEVHNLLNEPDQLIVGVG